MNNFPKLRFLEAVPLEDEQEQHFALRDPSGIAEEVLVVSGEALFLMQFFDGKHALLDMRAEYQRAFGAFLPEERLHKLVAQLEHMHFLEGASFQEYKRNLEKGVLAQTTRRAAHAGSSYPLEPQALRAQLEQFYINSGGAINGGPNQTNARNGARVLGLIAPHIDLRVGGTCYTHAYRALAKSAPADVFVILGTGHSGLYNCYSCLPQDFETPLGLVKHDAEFIRELAQQHPFELFAEPLPHRSEHTIEFQTIYLQHLLGGKQSFTIVPILCSYAYVMMTDERCKRERKIIEAFVEALRKACAQQTARGRKVCVIASVDFSHVGPRYGEAETPDAAFLNQVRAADFELIDAITKVDAERFVANAARIEDRYRVCGFAPMHTLLAATTAKSGKLLQYEQGRVDDHKSVVSYASLALY
ncbi:MAG: AmmeMemoRadiSam system protein B [candidate division KSB1 bacterium]